MLNAKYFRSFLVGLGAIWLAACQAAPPPFQCTDSGQRAAASVQLHYSHETQTIPTATGKIASFWQLQGVSVHLAALFARQLKVWVHQLTPEGDSVGLTGRLAVHYGQEKKEFDLKLSSEQVMLPLNGEVCQVEIGLDQP